MFCTVRSPGRCRRRSLQSRGFEGVPGMPELCGDHAAVWLTAALKASEPKPFIEQACQECNGRPAEPGIAVCFDCRVMAEKRAVVAA